MTNRLDKWIMNLYAEPIANVFLCGSEIGDPSFEFRMNNNENFKSLCRNKSIGKWPVYDYDYTDDDTKTKIMGNEGSIETMM